MKPSRSILNSAILFSWLSIASLHAGTFPGTAYTSATDSTGDLSWKTSNSALTVSCWFKISVPSNVSLSDNMVILVNNSTGNTSSVYSYLIQYNITTGNVEFSSHGATGTFTQVLVSRPYLDRWYHVAVVRSGTGYTGYLDGRQVFSSNQDVGNSTSTDGISIGGWNSGKYLYGEIQEAAVYQSALSQELIASFMYLDQDPTKLPSLRGYYKLAYSTSTADNLKNFASSPATGTNPLTAHGTLTFEQANIGGEQSLFDTKKNGGRDALTPLSGSFSWQQSTITRSTAGVPFEFKIGYSSGNVFNSQTLGTFDPFASSVLGSGWRNTFDARVVPSNYFDPVGGLNSVGLMLWDGSLVVWDLVNVKTGLYQPRDGQYKGEFTVNIFSGTCTWTTPDRLVYTFESPLTGPSILFGRLNQISDMNGNTLTVTWDQTLGIITKVTDSAGTDWTFNYNAQNQLTSVTGAGWTLAFTYDTNNRLATKTLTGPAAYSGPPALNTQWQFAYDATTGLLNRIVDPRGNNTVQVTYDTYGRKTSVSDALNRTQQFVYEVTGSRQIKTTDAAGKIWIDAFDRLSNLLSRTDPLSHVVTDVYDANGNITQTTDAAGNVTQFTYDTRANVLSKTDALGNVWQWQYNFTLNGGVAWNKPTQEIRPATVEAPGGWQTNYTYDPVTGNLLTQSDGIGNLVTYTYTAQGLPKTVTDGDGHASSFTYTPEGFLLTKTDAAGKQTSFTRSELGWTLSQTNPLFETASYSYNINGQVVQITDALGRVVKKSYDNNGNLVTETDAKNQTTTYSYDNEDQRTSMTDRAGKNWSYSYNSRGFPETVSDPSLPGGTGPTITKTYDDARRLITETDALGHVVSHEYDANGNQTALVDKNGQRWTKTYDKLNRTLTSTDPLGNTTSMVYDAAGRVQSTTNPRGFTQTNAYDGRSRLTQWKDAMGFQWLYTYDGVGNILDIQDALQGHYTMTYGPRNERLTEKNQDNKTWTYTYDELARLSTQTDPNGVTRTLTYDGGGRLTNVDFSTGRRHVLTYDDNNNPRTVNRSGNGVITNTTLTYDVMDRVATNTDTFGQMVGYTYDAIGRVQTIVYPGAKSLTRAYDAGGRLTTLTDWANRVSNFTYDNADRLISRGYPNGLTQTLTYDNASRVTTLQHQQGATALIALNYAYDNNGNPTSITEKGTLNWSPPAAYDQTSTVTPAGRLISKTDAADPTHSKDFTYTYDSNGNMTLASSASHSYTLTYDEDNRVLTVGLTQIPTNHSISNRYDALGRRVSRIMDGSETRYVLDLSGGMERILCDTDASGNILARYVHAADLCYKEDAQTGALTCYHSDTQANIIRTTNNTGATINEYAYSPYGRVLAQNGTANDPYLFVGSQGVMQELPGLYFMRARYYSADAGVFLSTDPVRHIGPGWQSNAYGYGGGNPMLYGDSRGAFVEILAGALLGGTVSAGLDIARQWGSGNKIRWQEVGANFLGGAISGGIAASGAGILIAAVGGATGAIIQDTTDGSKHSVQDYAFDGIVGAISGGAGGALEDVNFSRTGTLFTNTSGWFSPTTVTGALTGVQAQNGVIKDIAISTMTLGATTAGGYIAGGSTQPGKPSTGGTSGGGGAPVSNISSSSGGGGGGVSFAFSMVGTQSAYSVATGYNSVQSTAPTMFPLVSVSSSATSTNTKTSTSSTVSSAGGGIVSNISKGVSSIVSTGVSIVQSVWNSVSSFFHF